MNTLREATELLYVKLLLLVAWLYGKCAGLLTEDELFLLKKADEILYRHFGRKMR